MSASVKQFVLVVLTLGFAAGAAALLISSRKEPQRVEHPVLGPLVEVQRVERTTVQVEVVGQGEVKPRTQVELAPQVTGRVVEVHPALVSGGRFRAGTVLFRIDPRDYQLAVERARASVAGAETVLERELAESEAAEAEWQEVRGDETPPTLLVRTPQIREARARLAAAEADLSRAELDLERTGVSLPFHGLVIEESIAPGQLVTAGQRVATIFGTKAVEVRLPLDDAELAWFDLPSATTAPVAATVEADLGGAHQVWQGWLERLEGQVDPKSRMVHVVVRVDDPFAPGDRPPLFPGSFVDVTLKGRDLEGVLAIPRHALREGNTLWVVQEDHLSIRQVEVARRDRDQVLIKSGVEAGELVVTSALDVATEGMIVRVSGEVHHG